MALYNNTYIHTLFICKTLLFRSIDTRSFGDPCRPVHPESDEGRREWGGGLRVQPGHPAPDQLPLRHGNSRDQRVPQEGQVSPPLHQGQGQETLREQQCLGGCGRAVSKNKSR